MLKRLVPFAHSISIFDINICFFKEHGIKYVFADLDNTLDSYKTATPSQRVFDLKKQLNDNGIEMLITSNNTGKRVTLYSNALGVRFISSVRKPFSKKLIRKMRELNINPAEVAMIGDQVVTDIGCANGAGIMSILTDKIVKEDQPTTRFNRLFDRPLRKRLAKLNKLRDWRNV